jgi:hypothetical protein
VLNRTFPTLLSDFTVVIDADREYSASDLGAVVTPLRSREADWVLGSRCGFGRRRPSQDRLTYLVNRLIDAWFFIWSGIRLRDLLTGLYGFRTELVTGLELREKRFSYTAELIWKVLRKREIRLREVPGSYRFRPYAEGKKIRWWETATIVLAVLRYRLVPGPRS